MAEVARDDCHWCVPGVRCGKICRGIPISGEEDRIRLNVIICQKYTMIPSILGGMHNFKTKTTKPRMRYLLN